MSTVVRPVQIRSQRTPGHSSHFCARVFVNSMSDLFHDEVPDRYIVAAFEVLAAADWHTYQILTKRPERMRRMLENDLEFAARLPHIWWGVTVENKQHGLRRRSALSLL